ncbi:histone-lysine N-methyltransferase SETMAR [Trichonephila clavipes]|nr:histone-lysine N-methyltransferase SETMAR [Trichonephila clavipes]
MSSRRETTESERLLDVKWSKEGKSLREITSDKREKQLHTPAQSPDLNVIENLWSQLEKAVHEHEITRKEVLKKVLREGWAKLSVETTKTLVESMPRRLQAIIQAKDFRAIEGHDINSRTQSRRSASWDRRNEKWPYCGSERVKLGVTWLLKIEVNKEKIRFFLQFFFDEGENGSQKAEIANGTYVVDTVTANYVQFWFRRFRSGIFDVKDAPRTGRPVVENIDKITEIIEVDRHVRSPRITQELKIDHTIVLNHLRKIGLKKKLHVWVQHQLTPKNMMDRISICEVLAKWNGIDPFLKWSVTEDEKCVTYHNIVRKRSWSKCGEAAQTRNNTAR